MNLLRVLLCSVLGLHPSDVPPKFKIPVKIGKCGNGRRNGVFLHISIKTASNCRRFGVRQWPPCGVEFVCIPCEANNSKSIASDGVRVQVPPPAPKVHRNFDRITVDFFYARKLFEIKLSGCFAHQWTPLRSNSAAGFYVFYSFGGFCTTVIVKQPNPDSWAQWLNCNPGKPWHHTNTMTYAF